MMIFVCITNIIFWYWWSFKSVYLLLFIISYYPSYLGKL